MMEPVRPSVCTRVRWISLVPGGRSISRKSSSPQLVSVRSCLSALEAILPRHSTGLSLLTKNPMESKRIPYFSTGAMSSLPSTSSRTGRASSQPNIFGCDGPKISASSSPTLYPSFASATARLAETVLLPTPPFPEKIARVFFTLGSSGRDSVGTTSGTLTRILPTMSTSFDIYVCMAVSAARTTDLMKGEFGLSKIREKLTFIPSIRISSSTIPASTRFCPVPG